MPGLPPVILVAEDDAATLSLLEAALADEGYTPVCCEGEEDTMAQVLAACPDLLIVDLHLQKPDSGVHIVERLRQYAGTRDLPVLVCSADLQFLRECGAPLRALGCDLLEKPFELDELLAKVAAGLRRVVQAGSPAPAAMPSPA